MKLFGKDQSEVEQAVAEVLRLKDERHELLVKKLRAIDAGDGDALVEADNLLRENRLRIAAAEKGVEIAKAKDLKSRADELPALRRQHDDAFVQVAQLALMHKEISGRALEVVGRGDLAARLRASVEPVWDLAQITIDPMAEARAPGKALADEYLRSNPLPDLQAMRQELQMVESGAAGDHYALRSASKRAINSALLKAIGPEEARKRHELERRASARA